MRSSSLECLELRIAPAAISPVGVTASDTNASKSDSPRGGISLNAVAQDEVVELSLTGASAVEGDPDLVFGTGTHTKPMVFVATLSAPSATDVTFSVLAEEQSRMGNRATAGSDFLVPRDAIDPNLPLTVTIPAGALNRSFSIAIQQDSTFERTEFFTVRLSDVTGAAPGSVVATGTIYDDDLYVKGHVARWTDVDGDVATLTVSKGNLSSDLLAFKKDYFGDEIQISPRGGRTLMLLNLADTKQRFSHANVTVTSEQQPDASGNYIGNGRVDIGYIRASDVVSSLSPFEARGVNLGTVTVDGDLSRIDAGTPFHGLGLGRLDVYSLGVASAATDSGYYEYSANLSEIQFGIGSIKVAQDVEGTIEVIGGRSGSIGRLWIGGMLHGGAADNSGRIITAGRIGHATIQEIVGGAGAYSGSISCFTDLSALGALEVIGSLTGGTGEGSGSVIVSKIGAITVGGSMHGGLIAADQKLGTVTISNDLDNGAVIAGAGEADSRAIGGVVVHGNVSNAKVLAGYTPRTAGYLSSLRGVNADAQIGQVQVDGSVSRLDVLAGVMDGGYRFTSPLIDLPGRTSKIAQVILNGEVVPDSDRSHFLTAQQISHLTVGGVAQTIPNVSAEIVSGSNFYIKLVA